MPAGTEKFLALYNNKCSSLKGFSILRLTAIFKNLLVIRKNYIIFLCEPYGRVLKHPASYFSLQRNSAL
jgi:hypothetical protein